MGLFSKTVTVLECKELKVGEFNPNNPPTFYDNVHTFPMAVKPKHNLRYKIHSTGPVSIAIANSENCSVHHKEDVTDFEYGPIPTGDNHEMGVLLGVFMGDKVTVDLIVTMSKD